MISWLLGWREWPLHEAVERNDLESLARVVKTVPSSELDARRKRFRLDSGPHVLTALELAVKRANKEAVSLLLEAGATVTYSACTGCFLHDRLDPSLIELLVDGNKGKPLPFYECDDGLALAFRNPDWNEKDVWRVTELLLENSGMDPRDHRELTQNNETLLHLASSCGHVEICRRLLDMGISPNSPAFRSGTPLSTALMTADLHGEKTAQLLDLLLQHGADVDIGGSPNQLYIDAEPDSIADVREYSEQPPGRSQPKRLLEGLQKDEPELWKDIEPILQKHHVTVKRARRHEEND